MNLKALLVIPIFILSLGNITVAQNISAGIFTGVSNYQGDIVKYQIIPRESNFAYGGFFRYTLSRKFSIKSNVYFGKLSGTDNNFPDRISRGYSFSTKILEGGINFEYDPFGKGRYNKKGLFTPVRTPYIFTGIGAVKFNPVTKGLRDDAKENKFFENRQTVFNYMIPFGIGYKYDYNEHFSLGIELSSHLPFSDYMDGVSESADPLHNDWYVFGGLTASYWFTVKKKKKN
ncbi:MAG: DUF6089 family protein [Saprospiraceae bacterium]